MKQLTLAAVGFERYAKTTRRAAFLAEMERFVPWSALCDADRAVLSAAG
jgi:IS5 family transposase